LEKFGQKAFAAPKICSLLHLCIGTQTRTSTAALATATSKVAYDSIERRQKYSSSCLRDLEAPLGTLICGEPAAVNTRAVSMWVQTCIGWDQRGDPSETSQALTCHPAVVILSYCQPCHEAVICLSQPTNPGQSSCGGNLHPLGCSGRGGSVEMLQSLGCHLAVMVLYVAMSLDV